jgi:hypothetical protein
VFCDEGKETAQCRQAAVARIYGRAALLLDVLEECQHFGTREVFQAESRYCLVLALSDESEKQAPGVAIRQYRPMRSVALFNQPFVKEGVEQFG